MSFQPIFVFGSNAAGRHGAGAAKFAALHCGAVYGEGEGLFGQSYALPTMDGNIAPLSVGEIKRKVTAFLDFATSNPGMSFCVTAVGCGLGGKEPAEIAHLFAGAPENVFLSAKLINHLFGE